MDGRTCPTRVRTRKYAHTRIIAPAKNLVCCPNCGTYHESHTICVLQLSGTCYEQVRKITNQMKKKIMDYNPYIGERQQLPKQNEMSNVASESTVKSLNNEVWKGKRIVEAKKSQETWFKKIYRSQPDK
uniref:LysM domain-containing protein n=1 Tax=Syphacia muris TaxID=451379 RepID=A0A0N5AIS4_9BILA